MLLSVSRRYAAISPKRASSGACGTALASKAVAAIGAICVEICERRMLEEEEEEEEDFEVEEVGMTTTLEPHHRELLYVSQA